MSKFSLVISTSASPATSCGPKVLLLFLVDNAESILTSSKRAHSTFFFILYVFQHGQQRYSTYNKRRGKKNEQENEVKVTCKCPFLLPIGIGVEQQSASRRPVTKKFVVLNCKLSTCSCSAFHSTEIVDHHAGIIYLNSL